MDMLTGLPTEGTETRTSREIADEVARLGATLQAGANSDYTTVAASSLAVFCDQILELLADVTLHPVFPENEVELAKQNTKESLKQQRAQPSFLAGETVARVMFGEHPYHVTAPTPESIDATTRDRLVEFHRSVFVANNAVLFVAGDVKQEVILEKVEDLFGGWQPGSVTTDQFPAPGFSDLAWSKASSDWGSSVTSATGKFTFSDFLNLFLFSEKYDLGLMIKALQTRGLFESLAEPNLVAESGKEAAPTWQSRCSSRSSGSS